MPALFKFHGILTTKDMYQKRTNGGKVCLHPVVRKHAHFRFRSASQGPRQQAFLPLKAKSGKVCPLYSSSMAFLPPRVLPKKGQMVVRYAHFRFWSADILTTQHSGSSLSLKKAKSGKVCLLNSMAFLPPSYRSWLCRIKLGKWW